MDLITYSAGSCLCLCELKYYYRYELCLRPRVDDNETRTTGSWTHAGMEAYVTQGLDAAIAVLNKLEADTPAIGPDVFKIQQRAARCRAMVRVAAEFWPVGTGRKLAEMRVEMPVFNPDTGASSRTFRYAGVLDGLDGSTLIDWKTVSDPAGFVQQKQIGYQTELYAAALAAQGIVVNSAVFRLITQPSIKFCNKDGGSSRVYEDRCVAWLKEDASRLMEHEMHVDPGRIREAQYWLWGVSKRILENRRTGRWMRNEYACRTWNRTCEYMPICQLEASGHDASWVIEQQYERADDPHPELSRREAVSPSGGGG
jgi:hypothetical protein